MDVLEGGWLPVHLTLMEFPDGAAVRAWLGSPEYQEIAALRTGNVRTELVLLENGD